MFHQAFLPTVEDPVAIRGLGSRLRRMCTGRATVLFQNMFCWTWVCNVICFRNFQPGAVELVSQKNCVLILGDRPNPLGLLNLFWWRGGGEGGGGICNKTAHQIRVRVNACAVHAYISCERMRSACLRFVPQTRWRVRAEAPRTAYRSARCAAADFRSSFFVDVMSVTCLFFFFFFLQFFGRLGELADLQRYGLCEIFVSKAKSKGLRNKSSGVMSKMWGSLIASPSSTTSKFPSCRAQALLLIVEISRAEGRYFWFRGFFFWSYASVKKAELHRGVMGVRPLVVASKLTIWRPWACACVRASWLWLRGPSPKWRKIAFDWKRILFKETEEGCKL